MTPAPSFFDRHQFLIRRLHSLSGLIPVGAFTVMHLTVNASVFGSPALFQRLVFHIHSLGPLLWIVEWAFIFIPILFHAILGLVITAGGKPNYSSYPLDSNIRYTLQRATGLIAFLFIAYHVFHMHGWFHNEIWSEWISKPLGGQQFAPYNAGSSAAEAMQASFVIPVIYAIGVLAIVFHLCNGIFTMGITWGFWISPKAQANAKVATNILMAVIAVIGMTSIAGLLTMSDIEKVRAAEDQAYETLVITGDVLPNEHKRSHHEAPDESSVEPNSQVED